MEFAMSPPALKRTSAILSLMAVACISACGGGGGGGGGSAATPAPAPTPVASAEPVLSPAPISLTQGISLGTPTWVSGSSATGGRGAPIGGVSCLVTEDYHVHAHLAVIKDGQALAIPAQIGLTGCAYEIHTHDQSGILHVETAAYHRLTLGQFFAVWGQPLSSTNVAGITGLPIAVYVNDGGTLSKYTGDIAEIELTRRREITIVLGTAVKQIPSYQWDPAL
jgi:hypothetical protein